jgi:hypothetical protein
MLMQMRHVARRVQPQKAPCIEVNFSEKIVCCDYLARTACYVLTDDALLIKM